MKALAMLVLCVALFAGCGAVAQTAQAEPAAPVSERDEYEARLTALSEHAAEQIQAAHEQAQLLMSEINRLNDELAHVEPEVVEVPRVVVRTVEREVEVSEGDLDLEGEIDLRRQLELRTAQLSKAMEVIGQMDAAINLLSAEPDASFVEDYGWIIIGFLTLVTGVLVYDRFAEKE